MAFGFGFNKQKLLSAAEKFVQQGKLQNAIAEYDKILKHDAKDLTVNNTIGDLYARLGDVSKAIECFKTVGDAYAAQGFTVKGIAMYKKITKLRPSVDGSLKLAELYTQQGLFNDARAQYLQVAEDFMKNGDLEQSVRLFQKVLEMDPENVPMRVKLAEVYVRLGKKKEAWEIFSAAAESLRARGSMAAAEDILKRMLVLDPGNGYVLLLRGKAALESDDPKSAVAYLEKAPDLDSHPEGLRALLKAYLQTGNTAKAAPIAEKLLTVHNDSEGLFLLAEGCSRLGQYHEALEVYARHVDRLLATDSAKLLASLHSLITHVRDNSVALDTLLLLLNKAGESTHINEVTELLAHSSVKDGNLARARDLYQMLATNEPQNQLHMQNHQQVVGRMEGLSPALGITADEGAVIVEELEATAPILDQSYPDAVAIAVRSAVTDADLFLSYNLPDKAVVPLLGALPQAPRDTRLNQRLAALHTRFLRFTEAAVCCRTLESVYHDAGYPDEAVRYGELAERYEQNAAASPLPVALSSSAASSPVAPVAAPWPAIAPADHETADALPAEFSVQEATIQTPSDAHELSPDLSSEWEDSFSVGEHAPAAEVSADLNAVADVDSASNPEIAEIVEEIRFYLEHFMTDQARAGMEKLEAVTRDARILDPLRAAIESNSAPQADTEPEIAGINADEPAEFSIETGARGTPEIAASPDLMGGYHRESHDVISDPVAAELGFETPHAEPQQAESHAVPAQAEAAPAETSELTSFVADLEAALGDSFPQAAPLVQDPAATQSPLPQSMQGWPLAPVSAKADVPVEGSPHETEPASAAMPAMAASAGVAATTPAISYSTASVRPLGAGAQAMHPSGSVDLSEMFGELKQELEEDVAAGDDDPETHYNLGVAFREMGLLDEAIAELQKVCNSIERGQPFSQPVQTYTWLAQCFLDKGVPEAAIRWYEKALTLPGLDGEARLAIIYELGSACETAMDKPAALRHFTSVYGANIDYRDVGERIKALKS
jgi:pilus assembly protein FimV